MAGVNKVILVGNLGQDPEVKFMPSGDAVANVSIATSETWKDKNSGEKMERTEWHRVVFFGKIAEIVQKYLKKGSKVYIEGKLRTRLWEHDGSKRYATEVVVDMNGTMQMLDGKQDGQGAPSRPAQGGRMDPQNRASMAAQAPSFEEDLDIPF